MDELTRNLTDKEYRHGFVESFYDTVIAAQIKALRKQKGWKQQELGEKTGTTQSGISMFEADDYSRWSVPTLRKFAREFDVGLIVRFERFSRILDAIEGFGEAEVFLPPYAEDDPATKISSSDDIVRIHVGPRAKSQETGPTQEATFGAKWAPITESAENA